jgi:hypothetical protein
MWVAALIGVVAATAPTPSADPFAAAPSPGVQRMLQAQCRNPDTVLPDLRTAEQTPDQSLAKAKLDAVVANCGTNEASFLARQVRAYLALRDKDYDLALRLLEPVTRPMRRSLGVEVNWTAMLALAGKGDVAGFQAERGRILAEADQALTAEGGPFQGRRIETFQVGGNQVTAYQARVPQGQFVRLTEFVITPPGPLALPRSVMLTEDDTARAVMQQTAAKAPAADFVDAYDCHRHVTLKMLPTKDGAPPPYPEIKALVVGFLQGSGGAISSMTPGADNMSACRWAEFITPGL